DQIKSPSVVRATKSVGQPGISDLAFPNDSQAGIDDLALDSLGIEKPGPRGHVLPFGAVCVVAIERADGPAFFLLPIATQDAKNFLDIPQPHRLVVHDHRALVRYWIRRQPHRALPKLGFHVPLKKIERFHKMAVPIDDSRHTKPLKKQLSGNCSAGYGY